MNKSQSEVSPSKFFAHLADRAMQFRLMKLALAIGNLPPEEITAERPEVIELRQLAQEMDDAA